MKTMGFTRIELRNWKNFPHAEVDLARRAFLIGPNAVGKSNFLDAFRFLRDLAQEEGGGLASALSGPVRGGIVKVRSLHAHRNTDVMIRATVRDDNGDGWRYEVSFGAGGALNGKPCLRTESVCRLSADGTEESKLNRPDADDRSDPRRLTQTAVQQIVANEKFRDLVLFFQSIRYLHIVPHLIREEQPTRPDQMGPDPYGRDLLERMRSTKKQQRESRLRRLQDALKIVVPQLEELHLHIDERGRPHLRARFKHWRGQSAYQDETQFSDGTLRLIGLLWALQDRRGPLLLEEPELSLHSGLVRRLAPLIARAQRAGDGRQVLVSTHSDTLLTDEGIAPEEVLLVRPAAEGSEILAGAGMDEVVNLMQAGLTAAEAIYPRSELPQEQMTFLDRLEP